MNAFTRQELTAIHLKRPGKSAVWKSEQSLFDRQPTTYLPIIDARAAHIVGYQAVAATESGTVDCLHKQIMNSPTPGLLLVELDAAGCLAKGRCQASHLCTLFMQDAWTERELVIQLHGRRHDGQYAQMQKRLQSAGISFAVSWDGRMNLPGIDTLIDARLLTFDAALLRPHWQPSAVKTVAQLLHVVRKLGIQTMLTGVSDGEEMENARKLGFDWLHGPLFNRLKVCG